MALSVGLQGFDVLSGIAATVLLEQADLGLKGGLQADDLVIGQFIGALDGDGKAAGLDDAVAVEMTMGAHVCSPFVKALLAGA
jgi:hypothetical protein